VVTRMARVAAVLVHGACAVACGADRGVCGGIAVADGVRVAACAVRCAIHGVVARRSDTNQRFDGARAVTCGGSPGACGGSRCAYSRRHPCYTRKPCGLLA